MGQASDIASIEGRPDAARIAPPLDTARLGRLFFAIAVTAAGVQQILLGAFVRLVPKLPAWAPAPAWLARLAGVVLVAIGIALLTGRRARAAALTLAGLLVVCFAFLHVRDLATNPGAAFMWTNPLKDLAVLGGALILLPVLPADGTDALAGLRRIDRGVAIGIVLFGVFLTFCGIEHFLYADFVTQLVPAWIPGRRFWTYFTGVCLIGGGIGIVVPRTARLAALLTGVMVFLWVVLLHIPRALAVPFDPGESSGVFEALGLSGVAFVRAATARAAAPRSSAPASYDRPGSPSRTRRSSRGVSPFAQAAARCATR
jgi:uncharacterized membrane protein